MLKDITEPQGAKSAFLYNKTMLQEFKTNTQTNQNKQTKNNLTSLLLD